MSEFQWVSAYQRLVYAYIDTRRSGWKTRDEPTGFLREINDLGVTILLLGTEAEKNCFFELLDEKVMSSFVAGTVLEQWSVPENVRQKALGVVRDEAKSSGYL